MRRVLILAPLLAACADLRDTPEDIDDWYTAADGLNVTEPVSFTSSPYGFSGSTAIVDIPSPDEGSFETYFATSMFAPACEGWQRSADLPVEIEGIVTIHPKYYFKTSGCQGDRDADSDEKYYGSYFIEDESGGMFVLGDTKVAHFNMGQRVRLKVRAVKESFGLRMVIAHDVEEIGREVEPIYYQEPTGPLGFDEMARVQRVTGTVISDASNFGELLIESDEGVTYSIKVDWEITRRKHAWDAGERIQVTGPVLYSYDIFSIVVMKVGQICVLDDNNDCEDTE
jgi:hypothetical protein